jgi:hypothetical protein
MQTNSFKLLSNNIKKINNLNNKENIKVKVIKVKVIKVKVIKVKRNGIKKLIGRLGLTHAQNKVIFNAGKTGLELN